MPARDRRHQIMQAAERLFTSRRFHEITMDDVAQAAQVGKGTLYRYFADKDDLFFQTATSGFDELCGLLERKVPEHAAFAEQILAVCRQVSDFFLRRRPLFRMMQAEDSRMLLCRGSLHDRWMEKRKALVAAVAQILKKGVAEGALRDDVPAEILAQFLLGMLRTRGRDLDEAPEPFQKHEIVVDLFCRGAARTGARAAESASDRRTREEGHTAHARQRAGAQ